LTVAESLIRFQDVLLFLRAFPQKRTKALAMPSKDRVWLNNNQHRAPVVPEAGQPEPQKAVHWG
jgi:hypothetical protein